MTHQQLIFLAACILVRDPDTPEDLHRKDSIARDSFRVALMTAEFFWYIYMDKIEKETPK